MKRANSTSSHSGDDESRLEPSSYTSENSISPKMSKFSFEGDFKRRPIQNLGGRSRHAEARDITLRKAQMERQKRENERARASAVLVLQAGYRGMRERKKLSLQLREEFQRDVAANYHVDVLERQMMRLNYFFKPEIDCQLLSDLGKAMLMLKNDLMLRVLRDERSMLRLRMILEKSLSIFSEPPTRTRTTVLRLLEAFTDWNQVETARQSTDMNPDSSRTEEVIAIIWSYLVLQKNFFDRYKMFLEGKLEVIDTETAKVALRNYDYTIYYQRFLEAIRRLSLTSRQYNIAKKTYTTKELIHVLLLKLAESTCTGILPRRNTPENGVIEFVICPRVAIELAMEHNGSTLWYSEWFQVLSKLREKVTWTGTNAESHRRTREILYCFLVMMRHNNVWEVRQADTLKTLNLLLESMDNRKLCYVLPNAPPADYIDYDDFDEEWFDEVPGGRKNSYIEETMEFFGERSKIYTELKTVLNKMRLHLWMGEFHPLKWEILYPVISSVIEVEPKMAAINFNFLPSLYNKPSFMRAMCLYVMGYNNRTREELVVLCWLLSQLMKVLHDGEFFTGIPLSNDQLLHLIKLLEDVYADIVLGDNDLRDKTECYFKKEIAQTLMSIHDRNTRLNIFSEDVFLSNKFAVVFPMETHSIKFRDFTTTSAHDPRGDNLSILDQRLLRVLNDFPFALSFHDRVSIWHQMLHTDHAERHILDNPLGRQHIQIRRSYIYEDAFEKLSMENVPDLRSDVRISLVNVVGVQEAGVDGGGLLREFLTEATKAGVDPNRGLFRTDSENRIYPNPIARRIFPDFLKHFFLMGRLVGKALYRQILLELPLAAFFMQLCAFGSVSSAVDYLSTLDPDLHKNLLKLKNFDGDFSELGLDFTITSEELGETKVIELKPNGRNYSVDRRNVIEYIHLVADYKINREIAEECNAFRCGLHDVVPILRIFSWKEMQTLISGSDKPINVEDWKANTNYAGGYTADHKTIEMFWQVVEHFDEEHLRKLLKFVTSCSRPPLLGFKDLIPKFGISNAGVTDRLPTAATCMNLLKLPEFSDLDTLRERLVYAINAQAGFELS